MAEFKSGFVAIIGRTNVGKSTLINKLVGEKVAITVNKSQTTRTAIRAIVNRENSQIIFIDTPGIHKPTTKLGETMLETSYGIAGDVDLILYIVDCSKKEITKLENIKFNTEVRVFHNDNLYYHENTFDVDYEDCTFYDDNMEDIGRTIDEMIKRFGEDIYSMNRELTKKGYALFDAFPNRDMAILNLRKNEYFKDGTIYDLS